MGYLQQLGIRLADHRPVDLKGVPQIPDRASFLLGLGHRELPPELEAEANERISAAMREIQTRRFADIAATRDEFPDPDLSDFED